MLNENSQILEAGFSFEGGDGGGHNIACFFTEVSHDLVQTTSYILKPLAYREA